MDQIQHKYVETRGLKLHIAEIGTGDSVVVFLHGFPEIWYSWRYQMIAVANAGFRAIAPDYRGYGLSDIPPEPEKASYSDLIQDLLSIFDSLAISKAFIVGKDFGARPAYQFALEHPERVIGVATLGVPFVPPGFSSAFASPGCLPEGFYILRWQEPGRAEADFGRLEVKNVIRNIYILFSKSEVPIAEEDKEIMDLVDQSHPLPPWFTEEDLSAYASLYEKSGFRTALQVPYRALHEDYAVTNPKVQVPAMLIMGGKDYVLKFPGMEEYITSGKVKEFVPNLEITFLPEGTHFVQEQSPDQVNQLLMNFFRNHI
ncbi:Alpha/beta hydrolase fold-1 [Macleaya cordata]|uniref:Alpha/beta hydrolase fold-1 n=1 Tax=Macleaya cordata TaxID=56857 RepID=A0A200QRV8_MACCD|nr:Alpha/beta hydrolase fold-1 [Macleaya cordata]